MKNIGKVFIAAAILMIFAIPVQSQSNTTLAKQQDQQKSTANPTPGAFVDKDNNGICDNFESRAGNRKGANFVDKDGDGICDNFKSRSAKGRSSNFVDKDGDSICDNRANAGTLSANNRKNGQGNQYRHGQGQGKGRGCGNCCRR